MPTFPLSAATCRAVTPPAAATLTSAPLLTSPLSSCSEPAHRNVWEKNLGKTLSLQLFKGRRPPDFPPCWIQGEGHLCCSDKRAMTWERRTHAYRRRGVERLACCRCNEASADVLLIHSVYIRTMADEIHCHVFLPLACRSQTVPGGRAECPY